MTDTVVFPSHAKRDIVKGERDRLESGTTAIIDPKRNVDTLHDMTKKGVVDTVVVTMKERRGEVTDPLDPNHMMIQLSCPTL